MVSHKKAFTLVELVIVVVILAIVSTIGFISYEAYLVDTRDSKRLFQLSSLRDAMRLSIARGVLSLPDNYVEIKNMGTTFLYQGYAGESLLESILYSKNTKDPLDDQYYTYMLAKNKKDFQLMGFLEKDELIPETTFVSSTYAANIEYSERFPKVFGKQLGILLSQTGSAPLQEMKEYSKTLGGSGFMDLNVSTTNTFVSYITDSYKIYGKEKQLLGIIPYVTCKKILELNGSIGNGVYSVNPSGSAPFKAYCDMTTDGGGWMFTTFISTVGSTTGLFQGTSAGGLYYPDRRESVSYGLNTASIPHTEMYMVIDQANVTPQALTDRKVLNIQYDYRYPLFAIPYVANTSYSMRFGFTDAFVSNGFFYKRPPEQYVEVCVRKPTYTFFGLCIGENGLTYPNEFARLPENFYNTSLDTSGLALASKTWVYIR